MEKLLIRQNSIFKAMKKLKNNITKDGKTKSTKERFDLSQKLEKYWKKFKSNHAKLSVHHISDKKHNIKKQYEHTEALYMKLKKSIQSGVELTQSKYSSAHLSSQLELLLQQETGEGVLAASNNQQAFSQQSEDSTPQQQPTLEVLKYAQDNGQDNDTSISVKELLVRSLLRRMSEPAEERKDPRLIPDTDRDLARVLRLRSRVIERVPRVSVLLDLTTRPPATPSPTTLAASRVRGTVETPTTPAATHPARDIQ